MTGKWFPRPAGTAIFVDDAFDAPPVTTQSAGEAYELVVQKAGAWPRDATTRRTIQEVRDRTGSWVIMPTASLPKSMWTWHGKQYPARYKKLYKDDPNDLSEEFPGRTPPPDSDNDGMPDAWETARGLNPGDASDGNKTTLSRKFTGADGYTNVEVYINALADSLVSPAP
jgi:hypothetical protein